MTDRTVGTRSGAAASGLGAWLAALGWRAVGAVEQVWSGWLFRHALLLILALALALRFALLAIPSTHHPDEIFQYLEPAHRLVTGYGVVTWEWREGIRSWFVPVLVAGPMALSEKLAPGSLAYLPLVRGLFALASLSVVLSFYAIGNRISRLHGLLAAFVAAIWFDFVFFAVHTLSEPLALALIMPAAAVLWRAETASWRKLAAAGFALGLAVIVRYQYVAAVGVLVMFTCKVRFRDLWLPIAAGGIAAALVGAAIDLWFGTAPFQWMFNNFSSNLIEGRSEDFGVRSPLFYPYYLIQFHWQSSTWPILGFAALAVRRYPALFAAAVVNVLLLSLIAHKELRFVLLSTAIVVLLFSLGLADAVRFVGDRLPARGRSLLVMAAVLLVAGISASLAMGERRRYEWTIEASRLRAMQEAHRTPDLCGFASYEIGAWATGGYTYLNRPVPMYLYWRASDAAALRRDAKSFNVIVAPPASAPALPPGYVRGACFGSGARSVPVVPGSGSAAETACVFRRPGGCTPGATEINRTVIDLDI